jgi:hypothetical protein
MDGVAQPELFGGMFQRVDRKRSVRERMRELTDLYGPMYPQSLLPWVLDLSKQRVSQFVQEGRLPAFEVAGHNYIPQRDVEAFCEEERVNGRPVRELTLRESYRKILLRK